MATATALQAHYDEISSQMQVLPLAAGPKAFAQLDIMQLADGATSATAVARLLSKASAELQQCQICGCSCCSSQLGFLVSTRLDFSKRGVHTKAGQFACEVCRALSSSTLLLQLSTPVPQSEDFERADQLRELYLHFAAVNSAPAHVTSNPEALGLWVQELACRTYSMHVVANSLKGWKLVGPDGKVVQPGTAGAALNLLQQLLQQQRSSADAATATEPAGAVVPLSKAKKQKHQDKQEQLKVNNSMQAVSKRKFVLEADVSSKTKKVKKHQQQPEADTADAAAAAVASKQTRKLQKQQHEQQAKTPKHQQEQQGGHTLQTSRQLLQTPEQQQAAKSPKQQQHSKIKKQKGIAATPLKAQQLQQQDDDTAGQKAKKLHKHSGAGAAPSKKTKAVAGMAVEGKPAVPFKTPQVSKTKKAVKAGKRRLSDPS